MTPFETWAVVYAFEQGQEVLSEGALSQGNALQKALRDGPSSRAAKLYELTNDEARWLKERRTQLINKQETEFEAAKIAAARIHAKCQQTIEPYRFENGQEFNEHAKLHAEAERAQKLDEDVMEVVSMYSPRYDTFIFILPGQEKCHAAEGWKRVRVRFT